MAASFVEFQMEELRLVRPAVRAALELGVEEFDKIVAAGLHRGTQEFVDALRRVLPDAEQRNLEGLSRAVRRLELASVLDPGSTDDEVRAALRGLLARSFRRPAGAPAAAQGDLRRRDVADRAASGPGGRS